MNFSTTRRLITWTFFVASVMALLFTGQTVSMLITGFGWDYPRKISPRLPAATAQLLRTPWLFTTATKPAALLAMLAAGLIMWRVQPKESAYHWLSLLALLTYHLALMVIIFFIILFFVLPRAAAGSPM